DVQDVIALKSSVDALNKAAAGQSGKGAIAAKRLADDLARLAEGDESLRQRAQAAFIEPLHAALDQLRNYLEAQPVSLEILPPSIAREWVTEDGRYKLEIQPRGDPNDNETLRRFASAVQAAEPDAVGGPITILESGRTMVRAFFEAGFWAL